MSVCKLIGNKLVGMLGHVDFKGGGVECNGPRSPWPDPDSVVPRVVSYVESCLPCPV